MTVVNDITYTGYMIRILARYLFILAICHRGQMRLCQSLMAHFHVESLVHRVLRTATTEHQYMKNSREYPGLLSSYVY